MPAMWSGAIASGLALAAVAIGMYLTFRILSLPDLTVDGSFALGAGICGFMIVRGVDPWLIPPFSVLGGAMAGVTTGLLWTRMRINGILAGVLVSIALYTVTLRIMGRSNVAFLEKATILTPFRALITDSYLLAIAVFGVITVVILLAVNYLLHTEVGLALRATGDNERMARAQGIDTDRMKILCIAVSNGLVGLSGALLAQFMGFADIGMGTGIILVGAASLLIGEGILRPGSIIVALVGASFGSIAYRAIVALALISGLEATDMKLVTAVIVVAALAASSFFAGSGRFDLKKVVAWGREREAPTLPAVGGRVSQK